MSDVFLHDIAYVLGETRNDYFEAPCFRDTICKARMPNDRVMFGWGNYYSTNRSVVSLGIAAASQVLSKSGMNRGDVSLVIFCSSNFGDLIDNLAQEHYESVLSQLCLTNAHVIGLTLNNCTSLLSAVSVAHGLLVSGAHESILVISADRLSNEASRFSSYCVFSDSAVSFMMSLNANHGYKLIGCVFGSDNKLVANPSLFGDIELITKTGMKMLEAAHLRAVDIDMAFPSNLFLPITRIKEVGYGVPVDRIYMDNTPLIGHCFAADPFIGLVEYDRAFRASGGAKFALTSNSVGLRACALVESVGARS